jgi:hypothetical protein
LAAPSSAGSSAHTPSTSGSFCSITRIK